MNGEGKPPAASRSRSSALPRRYAIDLAFGEVIQSIPLEDVLLTWDRSLMQVFFDRGADPVTGNPFLVAFHNRVQRALGPFVDFKNAHAEFADALQLQADRALRHVGTPHEQKPSGRLGLRIWKPWNSLPKIWNDGKTKTLEDLLPEIAAAFLRIALEGKAADEKKAQEKAEDERRAEKRARRAETIRQEEARVRSLHRAAVHWERAQRLRYFVAAAREGAQADRVCVEPGSPFGDWLAWAAAQADRADPLKGSPPSIVDSKPKPEPPPTYYRYRKLDPPVRLPKPPWSPAH